MTWIIPLPGIPLQVRRRLSPNHRPVGLRPRDDRPTTALRFQYDLRGVDMRWWTTGLATMALGSAACTPDQKADPTRPPDVVDVDEDGFSADEDCDDANPDVRPDALEVCDGIDNNCDALVDDADPSLDLTTATAFYEDADGDGHGVATSTRRACIQPDGFSPLNTDCLDSDPLVFADGIEVCNGIDDDCDTLIDDDDDSVDTTTGVDAWVDSDADGHGDPEQPVQVCAAGDGTALTAGDCDDTTSARAPDLDEVCGDGIDNDCSGNDAGCGLHIQGDTTGAAVTIHTSSQIGLGLASRVLIHDQDRDGHNDLVVFADGFADEETGLFRSRGYIAHGPLTAGMTDVDAADSDPAVWTDDDMASASQLANRAISTATAGTTSSTPPPMHSRSPTMPRGRRWRSTPHGCTPSIPSVMSMETDSRMYSWVTSAFSSTPTGREPWR